MISIATPARIAAPSVPGSPIAGAVPGADGADAFAGLFADAIDGAGGAAMPVPAAAGVASPGLPAPMVPPRLPVSIDAARTGAAIDRPPGTPIPASDASVVRQNPVATGKPLPVVAALSGEAAVAAPLPLRASAIPMVNSPAQDGAGAIAPPPAPGTTTAALATSALTPVPVVAEAILPVANLPSATPPDGGVDATPAAPPRFAATEEVAVGMDIMPATRDAAAVPAPPRRFASADTSPETDSDTSDTDDADAAADAGPHAIPQPTTVPAPMMLVPTALSLTPPSAPVREAAPVTGTVDTGAATAMVAAPARAAMDVPVVDPSVVAQPILPAARAPVDSVPATVAARIVPVDLGPVDATMPIADASSATTVAAGSSVVAPPMLQVAAAIMASIPDIRAAGLAPAARDVTAIQAESRAQGVTSIQPIGSPDSGPTAAPVSTPPAFAAAPAVQPTPGAASTIRTDAIAPTVAPVAEPSRWSAATTAPIALAAIQPAPLQPGMVASAGQMFGAAMQAIATRDDPERATATPDTAVAALAGPAAPPIAATTDAQTPLDMRQDRWPEAMIARIEVLRDAADANGTRIRLIPDALGTIDVSVRRDGDNVQVHFTAEQPQTRTLLQDAQPRLADLAESRGIRLSQSGVAGGGATGGGDAGAGQQRQPTAPQPTLPKAPPRARAVRDDTTDTRLA